MSEGKWSGGIANRTWARTRGRVTDLEGDAERGPRLYEQLADERFLCEVCGRHHALREHRICRAGGTAARLLLAAVAFMVVVAGIAWLAAHSWWVTP